MNKFRIQKQEFINKTFRMPVDLVNRLSEIAQQKNISLTQMIIRSCEYALDNLEEESPDP